MARFTPIPYPKKGWQGPASGGKGSVMSADLRAESNPTIRYPLPAPTPPDEAMPVVRITVRESGDRAEQERQRLVEQLEERLGFETLLSELSARFIHLHP